jgi:hypothetical protein
MPRKYIPQVCHFAEPEKLLLLVVGARNWSSKTETSNNRSKEMKCTLWIHFSRPQ